MKKRLLSIVSAILIVSTLLSTVAIATMAPPTRSSAYINAYAKTLSASDKKLTVTYSIIGCGVMTSIGASSIKIYEKNGTAAWTVVKTFSYPSDSSLRSSKTTVHASTVTYTGTAGRQYYAEIVFYAGNSNGSDTRTVTTSIVTI